MKELYQQLLPIAILTTCEMSLKPMEFEQAFRAILPLSLICSTGGVPLSQGIWERIDVPTDIRLRPVWFADSLTGWALAFCYAMPPIAS
jgi:hypothetical protein